MGGDLSHLRHPCTTILNSAYDGNPAHYADREWIASTWAGRGAITYALVHDEYQGNTHAGRCHSHRYRRCWYNAITLAVSHNAGRTFTAVPGSVVAMLPYRYHPDTGPEGIFNPTNIVRASDGHFYVMAHLNIRDKIFGDCLLRTTSLSRAGAWRGWSGRSSFNMQFANPYTSRGASRLCRPVSPEALGDLLPGSISYARNAHRWVLVGVKEGGIFYSTSTNLISWSRLELLLPSVVPWTYHCGQGDPVNYPALIDPSSSDQNFQTIGPSAFLYLTLFRPKSCAMGADRALIRVPVSISTSVD